MKQHDTHSKLKSNVHIIAWKIYQQKYKATWFSVANYGHSNVHQATPQFFKYSNWQH